MIECQGDSIALVCDSCSKTLDWYIPDLEAAPDWGCGYAQCVECTVKYPPHK